MGASQQTINALNNQNIIKSGRASLLKKLFSHLTGVPSVSGQSIDFSSYTQAGVVPVVDHTAKGYPIHVIVDAIYSTPQGGNTSGVQIGDANNPDDNFLFTNATLVSAATTAVAGGITTFATMTTVPASLTLPANQNLFVTGIGFGGDAGGIWALEVYDATNTAVLAYFICNNGSPSQSIGYPYLLIPFSASGARTIQLRCAGTAAANMTAWLTGYFGP